MNKNILSAYILVAGIIISGAIADTAFAQTDTPKISYPIAELGNCADQTACKAHCDIAENLDTCMSFAEKSGLMTTEETTAAKNFKKTGMTGPNGCKGKDECETYCGNPDYMDECIAFAEKNGLMSGQKLDNIKGQAKKVKAAITKGIKPPACGRKNECEAYCSLAEHMEECMNFSIEAGMMDVQEQQQATKVLSAIKKGIKPPACKGKEDCDAFCKSSEHMEECMNFAIGAGMVTGEEKAKAEKALGVIKQGIIPPACKGEDECKTYCGQAEHMDECLSFGVAIGQITQEKADMIRSGGPKKPDTGAGPGNGAGQGRGGPGEGAGPGNGAGQGGGNALGQTKPANPSKCIAECETVWKNSISALASETESCRSKGQYCREVTCETKDAEGNRSTAEVMHACNDAQCTPQEKICHDAVTEKDSRYTTKKDVCVMDCQKAAKPTKPTPPTQGQGINVNTGPNGGPGGMTPPSKPAKPMPPSGGPGGITPPTKPMPPTPPSPPSPPSGPSGF